MDNRQLDANLPVQDAPLLGLSSTEAARRFAQYGENALTEHHISALERLARFFWGPIPWMIEIAAVLSGVLRHWEDVAIILAMLFINAKPNSIGAEHNDAIGHSMTHSSEESSEWPHRELVATKN
jgi:magnesium-transporting ATPase (P-type)